MLYHVRTDREPREMDSDMRLPLITAVAAGAAAFSADGAALQPLENVEAFAEALIMHDFAFAQEVQRLDDLGVGRHVHQMLVCCPRFLFSRHILDDVGDRIARDGKHAGREGDTVRIGREHAVIVQRVVARKPGVGQFLTGAATHALQDHRTKHLPMPHFFGANIGERCLDTVIRHGEALRQVAQSGAQFCVSQRRAYF